MDVRCDLDAWNFIKTCEPDSAADILAALGSLTKAPAPTDLGWIEVGQYSILVIREPGSLVVTEVLSTTELMPGGGDWDPSDPIEVPLDPNVFNPPHASGSVGFPMTKDPSIRGPEITASAGGEEAHAAHAGHENSGLAIASSTSVAVDGSQPVATPVRPAWAGVAIQDWQGAIDGGAGIPCYLRGTRIQTLRGEVAVECLTVGDVVNTLTGWQPTCWIGRRRYVLAETEGHHAVLPVVIRANSIADGLPRCDLYVSPEHRVFIDGVLVRARLLTNGQSIVKWRDLDVVEYFHVELASHAIIFAEGLPAETFVDCDSRMMFDNALTYTGGATPRHVLCARDVEQGELLADIRHRIDIRAGLVQGDWRTGKPGRLIGNLERVTADGFVEGWAQDESAPERPVRLDIFTDGANIARVVANLHRDDLVAAGRGTGRHAFRVQLPFVPRRVEARRVGSRDVLGHLGI